MAKDTVFKYMIMGFLLFSILLFGYVKADEFIILDNSHINGSAMTNVSGSGVADYVTWWIGADRLSSQSTRGASIYANPDVNSLTFTFPNSSFDLTMIAPSPSSPFGNRSVYISMPLELTGSWLNYPSLITDGKIVSYNDIILNGTYGNGCLVFRDNSVQCSAASNTTSNGNASIVNYTTAGTLVRQMSNTELVQYNGSNPGSCSGLQVVTSSALGKDGVLTTTCSSPRSVWLLTAGMTTKVSANASLNWMSTQGVPFSTTLGQTLVQNYRLACQAAGVDYNVASFGLAGIFNVSIYKNNTLQATKQFNVTGNGDFNTAVNLTNGVKYDQNDWWTAAVYKLNGTYQVTNVILSIACTET